MSNVNKSSFSIKNKKYFIIGFILLLLSFVFLKLNTSNNTYITYFVIFLAVAFYLFFILAPHLKYHYWKYFKLKDGQALSLRSGHPGSPTTIFIKEKNVKKIKIYDNLISNGYVVKQGFSKIGEIRRDSGDKHIINRFVGYNGLENYIFEKIIDNNGQNFIIKIDNEEYKINNNIISLAGKNIANWKFISAKSAIFYFEAPIKIERKILILTAISSVLS